MTDHNRSEAVRDVPGQGRGMAAVRFGYGQPWPIEVRLRLGDANIAHVRRVAERAMTILEAAPIWSNPMGKIAVYAAITQCLTAIVLSGVDDEDIMLTTTLDVVAGRSKAS